MSALRVLHATPPEASGSGIGRYAHRMAREVMATGRVEIVATGVSGREVNSVRDVVTHARAVSRQAAAGGFDVLHVECGLGALREYWAAVAVLRERSLPVVLTIHDPARPVWMPWLTSVLRSRGRLTAAAWKLGGDAALHHERWVVNRTARVHTLTEAGRRDVLTTFDRLSDDHVVRIPHLSGLPSSAPQVERAGPLRVGYFGHWYGGKGLNSLVAAVSALDGAGIPVELTLSGSVSANAGRRLADAYRDAIVREIEASRASELIKLAGHIPDERVPEFLSGFDVVVLPYERGLSRTAASSVLHDVRAVGVPIIGTDARPLAEDIEHGVNGLIYPSGDTAALAAHLGLLALDAGRLAQLTDGARATAVAVRSQNVADQFVDLYQSAARTGPP